MVENKSKLIILNVALAVTIFLIPFYIFRFTFLGIPTNIFEIAVVLLLILTLVTRAGIKLKNFHPSSLFIILTCLFILSAVLGMAQAGFNLDSLGIFKSWMIVPIVFAATVLLIIEPANKLEPATCPNGAPQSRGNLKHVFFGLYASAIVVSLWALLQRVGVISTLFYQSGNADFNQYLGSSFRAFGPFESPNYLAMYLLPASLLSAGLFSKIKIQKSKLWKGTFYISLILPFLAIIFSQSRAGIIALLGAAAICAAILVYRRQQKRINKIFIISLSIILYSLFIILVLKYALRPDSDTIRFQIYQYSWDMIKSHWLLGIGAGNFHNIISSMPMTESFRTEGLPYALHPHNLYMSLWLNFGLLGLVSFLGLVVATIVRLLKSRIFVSLLLLGTLFAILIHGIFDTTYFKNDLSTLFWLTIALSLIISNSSQASNA